jgi:hypothetical protein
MHDVHDTCVKFCHLANWLKHCFFSLKLRPSVGIEDFLFLANIAGRGIAVWTGLWTLSMMQGKVVMQKRTRWKMVAAKSSVP